MKFYDSIDYLPTYNYFRIIDGDLRYIAKTDDYSEVKITEEFLEKYDKIQNQFSLAMNDQTSKEKRMIYAKILRLKHQYTITYNLYVLLAIKHDDEVGEAIRGLGFQYREEKRPTDLRKIKGELKNINAKIEELTQEKETEEINMFDCVASIEKFMGVKIDVHTMPTSQFLSYVRLLKNQN